MNHDKINTASLKKRYLYKLSANIFGALIGFVTQMIIPRGLGPRAYGDFNFLSNFFNQVTGFFEMGTSAGFYTKLSQRPNETGIVSFYMYFSVLVTAAVILFTGIAVTTSMQNKIWPEQSHLYIVLAAGFGILVWIVQILNHMTDAYGLTVATEIGRMSQKVIGLLLIVALYLYNELNLASFFYYQYFLHAFLAVIFVWIVAKSGYIKRYNWRLSRDQFRSYFREFYHYSHPLVSYALVGLIVGIFDRWLLQIFSGSIEQGFYGLSYQIGALCFLFTSAMTPLLMREFSIAHGENDLPKMATLFRRYIPLLYSIAAYFSCFIAIESDTVVSLMGGKDYSKAATAVLIMAFYPLHQTYGQLSGSVFFATGQTGLYRNIGIFFMILGLPVTYFLIAPANYGGLNAGATGLAIKMVAIQIIGVNVQLYYNTRLLNLSFRNYLFHQLGSVLCLLGLAYISKTFITVLMQPRFGDIFCFILSGISYTILVTACAYFVPAIFGLMREDIRSVIQEARSGLGMKPGKG